MSKIQEIKVLEHPGFRGETEVRVHSLEGFNYQAELASKILQQLSIVAGESDGEDSSGRQKFRLLTPQEAAIRACDIAAHTWDEFVKRGWTIKMPLPKLPNTKTIE